VEKSEADLLRLVRRIDRDTGTIKFLYQGSEIEPDEFEHRLQELKERGWVQRNAADRWTISELGESALTEAEDWEFVIEEVFDLELRPGPFFAGTISRGSMHQGDSFGITRAGAEVGTGRIFRIELMTKRDRPGLIAFTVRRPDLTDLLVGDVLNRWEPMAG
jgi:hypothetical protein